MKISNIYKSKSIWAIVIIVFIFGYFLGKAKPERESHENHDIIEKSSELWTCSMHPQIKLENPGQCPICFMDLIPLVKSGDDENDHQISLSESAQKLAEIRTTKVVRKHAFQEINLAGEIVLNTEETYAISSDVAGRIEKLFVNYDGEKIHRGDPLYEIYSPELYGIQEELIQQKKIVAKTENDINRTLLAGIRKKLNLLGLNNNQIKEIENSEKAKTKIIIYSQVNGTVISKNIKEGDYVKAGNHLFEISNLEKLWLMLDAYEKDISRLQNYQKVIFSAKALPGKKFEGTIDFIDPSLNSGSQSAKVRVIVDNQSGQFKPGYFINAEINVEIDANGNPIKESITNYENLPLLIPSSAPLITGKRAIVFVRIEKDESAVFEAREVVLAGKVGNYYVVLSGLKEGENVVYSGNFKIDSALQLEGKFSMMSLEDEKKVQISDDTKILVPIYNEYFNLQEMLVKDEFSMSKSHYRKFYQLLKTTKISHNNMPHDKMLKWKSVSETIINHEKDNFENIDELRASFEIISDNLIDLAKSFGNVGDLKFNEAFCPMAFGNKGAFWLQKEDQIANPYFGAKMLRCGEIKTTFQPQKIGE